MSTLKERATQLIKAIEDQDSATFNRCRVSIVAELADNDYMINPSENIFKFTSITDNLLVGRALTILLYDMSKTGPIYRRIVIAALYCLLKTIIQDKAGKNKETVAASMLLLILFQENEDFIGGEYIARGVRYNAEAAAYQFIGMTCVFYWIYKLSSFNIEIDSITSERFQKALEHTILDMHDENYRSKVIDFEFNNFDSMLKTLPLDFELKYPGVPFWEPEIVFPKIESMFGTSSIYFCLNRDKTTPFVKTTKNSDATSSASQNNTNMLQASTNSGCLSVIAIIVLFLSIFFFI